jgi:peptide-methionine (S)-S-oxide reductase
MNVRRFSVLSMFAIASLGASIASAASAPQSKSLQSHAAPAASRVEIATFAGGCFWCMETAFESRPGVLSVTSGYTGGHTQNPTYEEVGSGVTGHAESVEVRFDPTRTSYAKLLDIYWHSIDPTQKDGQFCDHGNQYRSAIFYHGEAQHRLAEQSKLAIEKSGVMKEPIVTQIVAASTFTAAEEYHQDFWKKDPGQYRSYRAGCGRDKRLAEIWGKAASVPLVH